MAIEKVVNISVNTASAVKSMDELGGSFEDVYGEVLPLTGKIGELEDRLYEMALAGEQGTESFKELSAEVGRMKKVIIDVDLEVDGLSTTMSQKVGGALSGVASGFELGMGAMAAFGVESEAVQSALLKVQSAMAISQGIQGIREAIPSFNALKVAIAKTAAGQWLLNAAQAAGAIGMKVLNAVMNANPVFLLITGVTALVGAIAYFTAETDKAEKMTKALNAQLEKMTQQSDLVIDSVRKRGEHELAMLEATGAGEDELHERRLQNLANEEKIREFSVLKEKSAIDAKREAYKQAVEEGQTDLAATLRDEIEGHRVTYNQLKSQHNDYNNAKQLEDAKYNEKVEADAEAQRQKNAQAYQAALERKKQQEANLLAEARQIEDMKLSIMSEGQKRQLEELNVWLTRQREDTLANEALTAAGKAEIIALAEEQARQKRNAILEENEIVLQTKQAENAELRKIQLDADVALYAEAEQKKTDAFGYHSQLRVEAAGKATQTMLDESAKYVDVTMQGLQALDELNSILTDDAVKRAGSNEAAAEAARKKGFERSKKLQLTMAIITGIQGVMAAFTAGSSMGPAGVVMGPVMAALAAVTAGINVAKIAKTKYEGGGGGGGGGSAPSAPSIGGGGSAPSFNIVGQGGANQLMEGLGAKPMKAYVVGGDVTTQQEADRKKIDNASM